MASTMPPNNPRGATARSRCFKGTGGERFPYDEHAQEKEVEADERPQGFAGKPDEHIGADCAANHARYGKTHQQLAVNIAEAPMGEARGAGGERLGCMDASTRGGWWNTESEQHRAGRHAIGHADRAIDHLRDEAYDDVKKYVVPHGKGPDRIVSAGCERLGVGISKSFAPDLITTLAGAEATRLPASSVHDVQTLSTSYSLTS
jgi:hypothetical protein